MSLSRFLDFTGALDEDLEFLSNTGTERIVSIIQETVNGGGIGTVTSVNTVLPVNGDISLTTDNIPEGTTNKYLTQTSYNTLTKNILTANGDILIRKNNEPDRLPIGTDTKLLSVSGSDLTWTNPKLNQLANLAPMMRENFTIDPNSTSNMLNWMMTQSNIFDNMILPNQDVNPFFWGTRGDTDYGEWKIQNTSANTLQIDTVNIVPAGIFIVFQFIRSLIANIMDDNLNDGTVRIRVNGINSGQTGGTVQILNTTVSDLGKFRTLTQGTGITLSQNDDTITISATATAVSLDDLSDVVITTPVNNNVLRYNGANWINGVLFTDNVTELTNLYYTNARVDTRVQSYFPSKTSILAGTGVNTYSNVTVPASNNQALVSDNTTTTGLAWKQLSLGGSYFSDLQITTPINGNILSHDGTKWINSSRLSTLETTVTNQGNQIANLGSWSANQTAPIVSPQTISVNQTTFPIIRSTYTAFQGVAPKDQNGVDMSGNVLYLNTGTATTTGPWNVNGGPVYANKTSQEQRQTFFRLLPADLAAIQANYNSNTLWLDSNIGSAGNGKGVVKVNYFYNNLPIGTYTFKSLNRGANSPNKVYLFGCKNFDQTFVFNFIADRTYTLPIAGVDYDLLYQDLVRPTTAGTFDVSITTTVVYSAIGMFFEAPGPGIGICGASLMTNSTATDTLIVGTTGTNVTYTNTSGSMIITRNGAIAGETWSISYAMLSFWYLHTIVMAICRNPNVINLSNTTISDTELRINNGTNNFNINNSAGTTTYLNIDIPNDRLKIPRNPWSHIYLPNNVAIFRVIAVANTFEKLNIGNIVDGITTNNPTVGCLTWDNVNNQFNWNVSGTFRVTFDITVQGLDPQGQCDIMLRNPQDNSLYAGTRKSFNFFNGQYENISISFVCSVNNTNKIGVYWWLPPAAVAPSSFNIICWSIVASNLLTQ